MERLTSIESSEPDGNVEPSYSYYNLLDSYIKCRYTHYMSKRLQVVLSDGEMGEIQAIAEQEHMTVSEWVRQALRAARRGRATKDAAKKITAIRAAARNEFPTGDIRQMLEEIERGYLS